MSSHFITSENIFVGLLNFLDSCVETGEFFFQALDKFQALGKIYKAKAFIKVYNYVEHPLAGNADYIQWGQVHRLPDIIDGGYKEGITIYQNRPMRGLEGVVSYTLPDGYRIYLFVKVGQKLVGRKENQLGICITPNAESDDWDHEYWYEKMISENSPCLKIHDKFTTSPRTLQCCRGDYCVQATMTSDNHANVTVRVLPKTLTGFANTLNDSADGFREFSQNDLDHILNIPDTCNSPI